MNPKRATAARLRQLVAHAVAPRFDEIDRRLDALTTQHASQVELDLFALRQQVEECLDLLRVQHERLRELCERLDAEVRAD